MTTVEVPRQRTRRPLVAVVCAVPLLAEALDSALEFADVRAFSSRAGDIAGLLRSVRPDAVVVDTDSSAEEAAVVAHELCIPVVHLSVRDRSLRLLRRSGHWEAVVSHEGPTPEAIRNAVAGGLYGRSGVGA
jgi:hypothetical protein